MSAVSTPTSQLWFLNTLVTIRVSESNGEDHISILEHHGPYGDSPPLHIHHTEDEIFHILEGEFRFVLDGQEHRRGNGDILLVPKGKPHTYLIESKKGAHWLTITANRDFERFVRAMSRSAERPELPEPSGPLSEEAIQMLTKTAAKYHIEVVGPPLH